MQLRRWRLLVLLAFMIAVSGACSAASGGGPATESPGTESPGTESPANAQPAPQSPANAQPAPESPATKLSVFAAASLTESFTEIAREFEQAHRGVAVTLSFGSSSTLAQQIQQGAPVDVFAAAAEAPMQLLEKSGDLAGAPEIFARNELAIAVPVGNPGKVTGLADFADESLVIALCAQQVPCGAAAQEVFAKAGITPAPDTYERDVKAALTKVILGEVDAALVYRTDIKAAGDQVAGIPIPSRYAVPNDYPIAASAGSSKLADEFLRFVRSSAGRSVLVAAGFTVP